MSITTFFNWLFVFVVGITFLTLIEYVGKAGTFWISGALSIISWFLIYYMVPETKNKSLEEIEKKWFEKKTFYSGTLFLEVFDEKRPSEPIVQLQKTYRNSSYLPSILKMASWAQGSERPVLVVVCSGNLNMGIPAKVLVIRPQ